MLTVYGQVLEVDIKNGRVAYLLRHGTHLTLWHYDEALTLTAGAPVVTRPRRS